MKDYSKIEHFSKVFYTENDGRPRPYIEIAFSNAPVGPMSLFDSSVHLVSPKTFGLIDSGADHTTIPYSIGKNIKLEPIRPDEIPFIVSGVGGNVHCIMRSCSIMMANRLKKEIYKFDETVWWKVPSPEIEKALSDLATQLATTVEFQNQAVEGTSLYDRFQTEIENIRLHIAAINSTLEGSTLIGRPFFENFEFIQFNHGDRDHEDRCFFNYKVKKRKIAEIIPIPE